MILHKSPPWLWRRQGSSRRRLSWHRPYTGVSVPAGKSSESARRAGSGEPEAVELPRWVFSPSPLPPKRHSVRRASASLIILMLSWGENTCQCLLLCPWRKKGFYQPQPPPPQGQPIDESRGVSLGGFSLNAQLIIPSSYLHTINGVILFWNNSSFWALLDKSDEDWPPLYLESHDLWKG